MDPLFLHVCKSHFSLLFQRYLWWIQSAQLTALFCFLQYYKDIAPLSSVLPCSEQEVCFLPCFCSSVCNMCFFSPLYAFKVFSLPLVLSNFNYFFHISCAWVCWISWTWGFFILIKFLKFWPVFLQIFPSSSPLWGL